MDLFRRGARSCSAAPTRSLVRKRRIVHMSPDSGRPEPRPKPVMSSRATPSVSIPKGSFEHVVIILKENHTFDCYFGTFPGAEGDSTLAHASDPPTGRFSNNHAAWLSRATGAVKKQYHLADIAA